jgi:hypothetical protein
MKHHKVRNVLLAILFLLIAVFLLTSFRAYRHYSDWKNHKDYFKGPNPKIESWMNIQTVEERFHLTRDQILGEANVSKGVNPRMTLDRLCAQYKIECGDFIIRLNSLAGK